MSHQSSKSASDGTHPKETPKEVSLSKLANDDAPVAVSDVDKLIAFAESIKLSEPKEKP